MTTCYHFTKKITENYKKVGTIGNSASQKFSFILILFICDNAITLKNFESSDNGNTVLKIVFVFFVKNAFMSSHVTVAIIFIRDLLLARLNINSFNG